MRGPARLLATLAIGAVAWTLWIRLPDDWLRSRISSPPPRSGAPPASPRDAGAHSTATPRDPGPNFGGGYSEPIGDVSVGEALAHYALGAELLGFGAYYEAASHLALARDALGDYRRICEMLALTYDQLNMTLDLAATMECLEREAREHESARLLFDRLDRQLDVEVEFQAAASDHFVASFPASGSTAGAIGDILAILEESRSRIAAELGVASARIVPVVVYEGEQFSRATDKPHWALGLYDGKIRIAIDGFGDRPERFELAIAHEYVHALTHELTDIRLPAWFREGLADNLARKDPLDRERLATEAGGIGVPLELDELRGDFTEMGRERAGRAYRQSFAMVHNLVREAGWAPLRDLLLVLTENPALTFAGAFDEIYGEAPEDYLARWYNLVPR